MNQRDKPTRGEFKQIYSDYLWTLDRELRAKGWPGIFPSAGGLRANKCPEGDPDEEVEPSIAMAESLVESPWGLVEGLNWEEQHSAHRGGIREVTVNRDLEAYVTDPDPQD